MVRIEALSDDVIQREWRSAVSHAGFELNDVAFWRGTNCPEEIADVAAQCFAPHMDPDPPYFFSQTQWEEAISEPFRDRHRVVLHDGHELPADLSDQCQQAFVGALLRHELEHSRQIAKWGPDLFNIYDQFIHPAMGRVFGGSIPGHYVNATPVELDANTAAANYLRDEHPDCIEVIAKSSHGDLGRMASSPQPVETLMARSIACLFIYRRPMEELTGDISIDKRLRIYSEEAADIWLRLVA